ncbi:phospholipase d like [Lecanosticta acicola]|uniref:Phospholipase d like n=1 Tax=Lecanosticta acicola TaxID=111012 RepID=A0AAI9E7Q0_9PEZI|nr:phospholipase d like [Lecanosticta acicola]
MPPESQRAKVHNVTFGTGYSIFHSTILPAIAQAETEVILTTCFWAPSPTLAALNQTLRTLSQTCLQNNKNKNKNEKIKIRIGFSSSSSSWSSSLTQKLLPPSRKTHPPSTWNSRFGLPSEDELPGLDVEVKSVFFLPLSVWHSKFVLVDRRRVFLPSCNVSWEEWLEGCVEMEGGGIVREFVEFWRGNWNWNCEGEEEGERGEEGQTDDEIIEDGIIAESHGSQLPSPIASAYTFLPSPHTRHPHFQPLPFQPPRPPPSTPLNTHLLAFLTTAQREIHLQTPNLTSPPVLEALTGALERGVAVTVITNEKLMVLEQLLTAGTTTARCVRALIGDYGRWRERRRGDEEAEVGVVGRPGRLRISYYEPLGGGGEGVEAVRSHLKLTIVDDRIVVFGSGNMDRASWYTSQELGVAFYSEELVAETRRLLEEKLKGRTRVVYDSG